MAGLSTIMVWAILCWGCGGQPAKPGTSAPANPLDIGGQPAEAIIITREAGLVPEAAILDSPMLAKLHGVLASAKGPAARALRAAWPGSAPVDAIGDAERIGFMHLLSKGQEKVVELAQTQMGQFIVFGLSADLIRDRGTVLKQDVMGSLIADWDLFGGDIPMSADEPPKDAGQTRRLDGPYFPGWFVLDQEALGERLLSGGNTQIEGMKRVLATQEMWIRVPARYSSRRPAGVLVWMDPTDAGQIPAPFGEVLDELNLIAIGAAGMGNAHELADRLQMGFDGLATVARRYHVDPGRFYVTGVSGGGKLSSILLCCFPEVFTGAVPIVGLSCYENLPTGVGGYWAGQFRKPPAKVFAMFRKQPMAAITGGRDFNQAPMRKAIEVYERDGCRVKMFEWEDLGHAVPSAARLSEAFAWVDGPVREARGSGEKAAGAELKKLRVRMEKKAMERAELVKEVARITKFAPWGEAAWEAVGLLGEEKK